MPIQFLFLQNRMGKTRLAKFYTATDYAERERQKTDVHKLINNRESRYSNFVEYKDKTKLVYRRYAGLFFCLGVDPSDNELVYLEFIHLLVEVLDMFFKDVCELDLVFNFHKVYMIIDELILGGEIQEMSRPVILERLKTMDLTSK
jgi:AP-2 complex subunit sigma-1